MDRRRSWLGRNIRESRRILPYIPCTGPPMTHGRSNQPPMLFTCLMRSGIALRIPQKDWSKVHRNRVTRILGLSGFIVKRATRADADEKGRRPEYWDAQGPSLGLISVEQ